MPEKEAHEALKKSFESILKEPWLETTSSLFLPSIIMLAIVKEAYDQSLLFSKPEGWLLKKVNDHLFLFLPKDYIEHFVLKKTLFL